MPDASDYGEYPEHVLNGVPQEVLDAARKATAQAAEWNDITDADMADPIADSVVAEIIEGGYRIISQADLGVLLSAAWSDVIPSEWEQHAVERAKDALG